MSSVLAVLIDNECSLKELSYKGPCPPLKILERFMVSQTELEKAIFVRGRLGMCQDQSGNSGPRTVQANPLNTGLFWIPLLSVILKNRRLTEINCHCRLFNQPRRQSEVTDVCNTLSRKAYFGLCMRVAVSVTDCDPNLFRALTTNVNLDILFRFFICKSNLEVCLRHLPITTFEGRFSIRFFFI